MNDIIMHVIETLIFVVFAIALRYAVPCLTSMLRAHNYDLAANIVETAVRAAEQIIIGAKRGEERYAYVQRTISEIFQKYDISLTEEQIQQLIEAAVQAMNVEKAASEPLTIEDETDEEGGE